MGSFSYSRSGCFLRPQIAQHALVSLSVEVAKIQASWSPTEQPPPTLLQTILPQFPESGQLSPCYLPPPLFAAPESSTQTSLFFLCVLTMTKRALAKQPGRIYRDSGSSTITT